MSGGHLFNNISLGGRDGTNPGQLRVVQTGGIMWKKQGGGGTDVEVDKADILGLTWMKVPRTNQLGVISKKGFKYKFTGFRDQTQLQGTNDVMLEFHADNTTGATEKDSLMEISFHIPDSNTHFVGDENCPPAQIFRNKILSMSDITPGGEEPVFTLEGIAILTPSQSHLSMSDIHLRGVFSSCQSLLHLFFMICSRGLKIMNHGGPQAADGVAAVFQNDDDVDPHLERIKNDAGGDESDEEDEDFVAEKDDSGSPTDDSGGEDSDASDNGGEKEKLAKKEPEKEPLAFPKEAASRKRTRTKDGEEDGVKKKKDPNAPKKPLSAFMFFSKAERENVKKTNPGISFTDVGRVLGERWNKMSGEEKDVYEADARQDKKLNPTLICKK
ncbi:hypothetical protein POM88_052878 [Heracleum sosnowskyi]|uniref:HMG box domain-containing protein n=1 Tax=Heracleum sosnowskyi TaxID=360622 RepID=A0AAD8LWE3_9APIA|nr:hypothetical protein POM88_052878 [Heracleum sosnowskyi]